MGIERVKTKSGKTKTIFRTSQHKPIVLKSRTKRPNKLSHEVRDCTVWSIVETTNKPYSKVHDYCKRNGRRDKGRANFTKLICNLDELGFKSHRISARYVYGKNITVKNYLLNYYKGENVIILVSGHAFPISNGVLIDNFPQSNFNCRIQSIYVIEAISS